MARASWLKYSLKVAGLKVRGFSPLMWVVVVMMVTLHGICVAEVPGTPESASLFPVFSVHGRMSAAYLLRTTVDGETRLTDHDLTEQISLGIDMPRNNLFELHFLGTLKEDLNGGRDVTGFFPYEDVEDTRTTSVFGYIHEFRMDINEILPFPGQVRVGRQAGTRREPVFFDGLAADIRVSPVLMASVYGGAAVHFHEIEYAWGSDWLGGIGLDLAPVDAVSMSVDYLFAYDARSTGPPMRDHLFSMGGWVRPAPFLGAGVRLRTVDLYVRDFGIEAIAAAYRLDLELAASFNIVPGRLSEFTTELSAYEDLLGDLFPHHSIEMGVRKLFGRCVAVDLGLYCRRLIPADAVATMFNRNFDRVFSTVEVNDICADGLCLALGGEFWRSEDRTELSGAFDIGYQSPRRPNGVQLAAGAQVSRLLYDYYPVAEIKQTEPSFHAGAELPLGAGFSLKGRYEIEGIETPHHRLELETRYEY